MTITKQLNQSSPQILNDADTNENLKTVVINFYQTTRTGAEVNFHRVTLTNADVSDVRQYSAGSTVSEDVSFTFQRITEESLPGHTSWTGDWAQAA